MTEVEAPEMSFEAAIAALKSQKAATQQAAPAESSPETPAVASAATAENPEPVPATGTASSEPPAQTAAPTPPANDPGKPQESAPVDPALKRLLDREAAIQAREKELTKLEAAKRKFKYDPVAAIREIDPDAPLSEIAKALWVEELGDLAPPEAKQAKEFRGVRSEVEELRAQVEEERRRLSEDYARQQQELVYGQYTGAIKGAVGSIDASKYPLVAGFHKKHSDSVVDELLAIARQHAQTAGEVLPPDQLVGRLETYLSRYQIGSPEPAPAPPPEATQGSTTQTLRNSHTQVQPNLKPADELDDDYLREQALKAVREDRKRRGLG